MLYDWPHKYAATNGINLHYVEAGPPDGRLVVLLHGFPEFWYSWRYQLGPLSEAGYRVIAPDLRGYNLSDKPETGYDIETLVEDVAGLIGAVGGKSATVVGHDWGGGLTWAFASFRPELTDALVVVNAPHFGPFQKALRRPRQMLRSWYMLFFQLPWLPERLLSAQDFRGISRQFAKSGMSDEDIQAYKDALSTEGTLTSGINYYRAAFRGQLRDAARGKFSAEWPVIDKSALLIWGTEDSFLGRETTEGTEQWVPNLRTEFVEGAGHWVQMERPDEVNRLMLEFLESALGPGPGRSEKPLQS
jgi:epoxide hydrolase 4